ncbi:hypothetical protein LVD15_24590 [Fulvivirga maritima]|uniref:hypothetical protein n=1 Tax=Fulvivirga maritima TaxID=2904247 RepID=UPI001F2FE0C0|nr:hypothetical protein [Fulvivirga maritima]UII26436.1 hypothetical protein LVD15_24590 [Fulvivirga maritima]
MRKSLITYLFLLSYFVTSAGTTDPDKEVKNTEPKDQPKEVKIEAANTRVFEELEWEEVEETKSDILRAEDFAPVLSDTLSAYEMRALELDEMITKNNRFVDVLDEKSLVDMPVGIKKNIGGLSYTISLDSIVMTPQGAYLVAYMVFEEPTSGKKLTFRGDQIKLSKNGGITGDARLELIGDQPFDLFGEKSVVKLKGNGTTFVEFDCNGFKMMGIGAEVTFSRDFIVPEKPDGSVNEKDRVIATFSTTLSNWNDLIAEVTLPPFQVNGLKGVGFKASAAVFDYSDLRNAPAVTFPKDYHTDMIAEHPDLWRGFYMREMIISLPQEFRVRDSANVRRSFRADNIIIDQQGFSGKISATDIIPLKKGSMNGWSYSLETIFIDIEANQLKEGGLTGGIRIPINSEDKIFEYSAIINTGGSYVFNVTAADSLEFDIFKTSKVEIYPSSYLKVSVENGKFLPEANLHGKMDINAPMGSQSAQLANITFEDLHLQSKKPFLTVGSFSFGSEAAQQAMANFPVSIDNIGMRNISDTELGVDFDLIVNLTSSFGGEAGLTLLGDLSDEGEGHRWKYKKLQVNDITVDIDQGAFKFYGRLQFFREDQVYGNGFNGVIDATFQPGINVQATAIFGKVNGMRFWYADAMASFPTPIPVVPPFGLNGFGGGAYYHMKMDNEGIGSDFGKTASGTVYVPDEKTGLGLKATIGFATVGSESLLNGDATFEIAFFAGGGVKSITFTGNAFLVTPPIGGDLLEKIESKTAKLVEVSKRYDGTKVGELIPDDDQTITEIHGGIGEAAGKRGSVSAHTKIVLDFENNSLHANMEMYVNVVGGIIKGVGAGGRAGWAVLHYDPSDWYFYLGTPEDRIGISAGVGPIRAQLTSYFMVGTKIPGSPPPPEIVSDILGGMDLDYMADENALGLGKGLGFGASLSVDTGDLTFLMFYARFQAGLGFDIMLKNYGDNVRCKGRKDPLGMNGWYANGQAYAYFDGEIGIRVKVFGKKKSVEILSIGAAVVLQAKLPNPFWMRGIVGGRYRVLGGLVKGNCKFEATIGEECEMIGGSVLEGIKVISQVTPVSGERDVNVFSTPQAVFNMPINKTFEMVDVDDEKKKFRIILDKFTVLSGGYEIIGDLEWNAGGDVIAFNSFDILPPKRELQMIVEVSFEEQSKKGWVPVFIGGKKYTEVSKTKFITGEAPDYIPLDNVAYSYPVLDQLNYYKDETHKGYISLKKGQPYLFQIDKDDWKQKGRLTSKGGKQSLFDYSYSPSNREISFSIPGDLSANAIYSYELVNLPAKASGAVDRNVYSDSISVSNEGFENDLKVTTKKAEGTISELQEKSVFSSHFKTSTYSTLSSKIDAADMRNQWRWPIRNGVHELGEVNRFI